MKDAQSRVGFVFGLQTCYAGVLFTDAQVTTRALQPRVRVPLDLHSSPGIFYSRGKFWPFL